VSKYDFDTPVDRRGTNSIKWRVSDSELPMWIADMDFRTAPEVIRAVNERAQHGVFGYAETDEAWENAYISWWKTRYGFEIDRSWLIFATGVVPAISSIVRKLGSPNENVVLQTPVYNIFFNSIINNGLRVLESPLEYENGQYSINFEDLEDKFADPQTSLFILCNPHNPVGRIWSREELAQIGELAFRYGVTVISDEIHCDITVPGKYYVPFASVSETCRAVSVTCVSPSKSFNVAGLNSAAVIVPDHFLRHRIWRGINTDEVGEPGVFACISTVAAYQHGAEWLDELRQYLFDNRAFAEKYIRDNIPDLFAVPGEATYLMWIDISKVCDSSSVFVKTLRHNTGLMVSAGSAYGKPGEGFIRVNIACPRSVLADGLERLRHGVEMMQTANHV